VSEVWLTPEDEQFAGDVIVGMRLAGTHPLWCSPERLEAYRAAGEAHRLSDTEEPPAMVAPTPMEF
jgi:hypothetical protein